MNNSNQLAIQTEGLTKHFGVIHALQDVSLQVPEGTIFGFLGPNGAGKSTLIRVLTGLIHASAGHFAILGRRSKHNFQLRQGIGALVDRADFYKQLSGYHNLELLARMSGHNKPSHLNDILHQVGLYNRRHDKVKSYSQGMKQRLGLGQALLGDPKLLILDEPTTGLDPIGMVEIRDFIRKIAEERSATIFLSSHLLHEVEELCTHIGLIFSGDLVAHGSIEDLFQHMGEITLDLEVTPTDVAEKFLNSNDLVQSCQQTATTLRVSILYENVPELLRQLARQEVNIFSASQKNRLEAFFLAQAEGK
ncbi:MAG: ABC transporter ATP-binding protein [Candidatus Marinimicrobia bacterium]|nr:ABC transporter ATP-binding protein [Candidatus Neomarinimicrobiota bacterium]MCF7839248.1 ABC transporter ATP-binding protein [Candidatus Neomarinimicrobiota bacterium]